jgi:hypothetical protein
MATRALLRGCLLEEALAWLTRSSGYRLLVHEDQDNVELVMDGSTLRVRGCGTVHQVDVPGEFAFTLEFSLPVRLLLEAKFYRTPGRLEVVRNAHGARRERELRDAADDAAPAPLPVRLRPVLGERLHGRGSAVCPGPPALPGGPLRRVLRVAARGDRGGRHGSWSLPRTATS